MSKENNEQIWLAGPEMLQWVDGKWVRVDVTIPTTDPMLLSFDAVHNKIMAILDDNEIELKQRLLTLNTYLRELLVDAETNNGHLLTALVTCKPLRHQEEIQEIYGLLVEKRKTNHKKK